MTLSTRSLLEEFEQPSYAVTKLAYFARNLVFMEPIFYCGEVYILYRVIPNITYDSLGAHSETYNAICYNEEDLIEITKHHPRYNHKDFYITDKKRTEEMVIAEHAEYVMSNGLRMYQGILTKLSFKELIGGRFKIFHQDLNTPVFMFSGGRMVRNVYDLSNPKFNTFTLIKNLTPKMLKQLNFQKVVPENQWEKDIEEYRQTLTHVS